MRLSGFKLPLDRLSSTSLSCFTTCPEQFRQKYLLKQPETMSGDRFVGSVMHQAFDRLFEPEMTVEMALNETWQKIIDREGEPEWYEADSVEAYRRSKLMLNTYLPIAQKLPVIAHEERFEEFIAGVTVVGYIDRELTDRILEVKTSSRKESKPKPRWSLQGRLYSLVSQKDIEYHVVTRQVTPKVYTAEEIPALYVPAANPDVTVRIVRQAVERMNDLYARYGPDQPWPVEGIYGDWTCGYCSFQKGCVAW